METIGGIAVVLIIILVSMVLHELAHGLVAYWLGDTTAKDEGRLTLNPLAHLEPFTSIILPVILYISGGPVFGGAKPVPINTRRLKWDEWGMALVALAGPVTNILIAFIGFLIGHFTGLLYADTVFGRIFLQIVSINLGFAVFNLIPIPPLDGSRVLYAIAPDGVREFMMIIEQRLGIMLIFVLVVFFGTALSQIMFGAIQGILRGFYLLVGMGVI